MKWPGDELIGEREGLISLIPGTVEEKIQLLQEDNKALADPLIQTDTGRLGVFSKADLLDLLSPTKK